MLHNLNKTKQIETIIHWEYFLQSHFPKSNMTPKVLVYIILHYSLICTKTDLPNIFCSFQSIIYKVARMIKTKQNNEIMQCPYLISFNNSHFFLK